MAHIKIQDTGYVKPTNEGTQASSGNIANSGTAISIKTAEFTPSLSKSVQDNPELGIATPSEVNSGSLENMKFLLTCKINTASNSESALIPVLLDMVATKGYKLMWYQYTSVTPERNNGQLIYRMATNSKFGHQTTDAEKTKFTISDNFYHLHVDFIDIQSRQSAKSKVVTYTLTGVVLKVETSVLT